MKRFVLKLLLVLLSLSCFQDVFAGPAHSTQRDKSRRRGANPCDVRTWCGRNAMPDSDDEDEQPSQHDGSTDGQDDGQTPRDNFPPETPTPDHSTGKPDKKKNRDESLVDHDEGENGSDEETFYKFINVEKPGNNYALIQGKLKVEVPFPNILMYCAPHSQDSNVAYVCIDYCGTGAMKMTLYNINDGSVIKTRTATREERPIIPLTTSMAQQIEALEQWCKDNEPTLDTTNPLDTGSVHETTPIVAPMLQDNVTGTHDDDDEQEGEGEDDDTSTASHGSPTDVDFSKIKHQTAPVNDDFEVVTHALSYDVIQSEDGDNAVLIHCAESEALYSIGHAKVLCCETFKENFEHIFLVARDYNGQVTIYILKKKGLTTVESKTFTPEEIQTLHIDADSDDYQVIWKYYKNKTISITRVSAQPDLTLEKLDEDEHTKHDNEDDVVFPSSGVVLEHTDDASSETTEQERFITQFVQKHSTAIQEGEKIERVLQRIFFG